MKINLVIKIGLVLLVLILSSTLIYSLTIPDPYVYYGFEEASGNLNDSGTANSYDATPYSTPTYRTKGINNYSVFLGATDAFNLSWGYGDWNQLDPLTINMWVNFSTPVIAGTVCMAGYGGAPENYLYVMYYGEGAGTGLIGGVIQNQVFYTDTSWLTINDSQWNMLTFLFYTGGTVQIYRNGIPYTMTDNIGATVNNSMNTDIGIGGRVRDDIGSFDSLNCANITFDELSIFHTNLSSAQIVELYNRTTEESPLFWNGTNWYNGTIVLSNGTYCGEYSYPNDDVILKGDIDVCDYNGNYTHNQSKGYLTIHARNIKVTGAVNATGDGYNGSKSGTGGPGEGSSCTGPGGGGNGGIGGTGFGCAGGQAYNYSSLVGMGGGGGEGSDSNGLGGGGGGYILLNASGELNISNFVESNGEMGQDAGNGGTGGGGGAGGGIWLIGNSCIGSGNITANGALGRVIIQHTGSGGGGRIRIDCGNNPITWDISTYSPSSSTLEGHEGTPGTIYINQKLIIKNKEACSPLPLIYTPISKYKSENFTSIDISNATVAFYNNTNVTSYINLSKSGYSIIYNSTFSNEFILNNTLTYYDNINITSNLTLSAKGILISNYSGILKIGDTFKINGDINHKQDGTNNVYLKIWAKNIIINKSGNINVSGRGYVNNSGPGSNQTIGGIFGGGFGGVGGDDALGVDGGPVYNTSKIVKWKGSGGGRSTFSNAYGNYGGGYVFLNASNLLNISGNITANGMDGVPDAISYGSGGGSGGGIWLIGAICRGNGRINASGGIGQNGAGTFDGGGGGGGRIRIDCLDNSSLSTKESVLGGSIVGGGSVGAVGTINRNTTYALYDLTTSLKAYWKMDTATTSGNTALDSFDSYDGTLTSVNVNSSTFKINESYHFDGVSKMVVTATTWTSSTGTINYWMDANAVTQMFEYNEDTNNIMGFVKTAGNNLLFYVVDGGVEQKNWDTGKAYPTNSWHMITWVQNSTHINLYYDGSWFNSTTNTLWFDDFSGSFSIGTWDGTTYYNGAFDEFGVWSRALSSSEITDLYNSGNGLSYPFTAAGADVDYPRLGDADNKTLNYNNQNTTMNITMRDDSGIDGYYFSWNATGSWVNDSWIDANDNLTFLANISMNLSYDPPRTIAWKYYANDTSNNTNGSASYILTIDNRNPSADDIAWVTSGGFTDNTLIYNNVLDNITATASDLDGISTIKNVTLNVTNPSGTSVYYDNITRNATSDVWIYNTSITLNQAGEWNISITVHDTAYGTGYRSEGITVETINQTLINSFYGFKDRTLMNQTAIDEYIQWNYNILELETNINTLSQYFNDTQRSINISNINNIKIGLSYILNINYSDANEIEKATGNITNNFSELRNAPYSDAVQYIILDINRSTDVPDTKITAVLNKIAKNITAVTQNEFPIYSIYNSSTLDTAYIKPTLIYYNEPGTDAAELINTESDFLRNTSSLNRVYVNLNTTFRDYAKTLHDTIYRKINDVPNVSTAITHTYVAELNNGDLIIFNNETERVRVKADVSAGTKTVGNDVWDVSNHLFIAKEIVDNITVSLSPHSGGALLLVTDIDRIQMDSMAYGTVYKSSTPATSLFNYTDGTSGGNWGTSGLNRAQITLWNGAYLKSGGLYSFAVYYGWLNASSTGTGIVKNPDGFCDYSILVIADNLSSSVNTLLKGCPNTNVFGYVAVADYNAVNSWSTTKKNEIDHWLEINATGMDGIFIDGFDLAADTDHNFTTAVKNVVDYVKVTKQKLTIANTYTNYTAFATWTDYAMKESCVSRWNGPDSANVHNYSWESWNLEKEKSTWYSDHNVKVLCMAFTNTTNQTIREDIFLAGRILGYEWVYISTPDFNSVSLDRFVDTQNNMAYDWSNDSLDLYVRRYTNGLIYHNSTSHESWIDNGVTIHNITLSVDMYGALNNILNFTVGPSSSLYQITNDQAWVAHWQDMPLSLTAGDAGKFNVTLWGNAITLYWDVVAGNDRNSYYSTDRGSSWTIYDEDKNWMVSLAINQSTSASIDTTINLTQYEILDKGVYNITLNSTYEINATIITYLTTIPYANISAIYWVNTSDGTRAVITPLNTTTCNTNTPLFNTNYSIGSCRQSSGTDTIFKFSVPHLSNQVFQLLADPTAPNITLISPSNGKTILKNATFEYIADDNQNIATCQLWTNTSGTWEVNKTNSTPNNSSLSVFHFTLPQNGTFIWNINCSDNVGSDSSAPENFTIKMNQYPILSNARTIINDAARDPAFGETGYIESSVTDNDGDIMAWAKFTMQAPNGTLTNINRSTGTQNGNLWKSANFTISYPGTWNWTIRGSDNNSLNATTEGYFYVKDTGAPNVSIIFPPDNKYQNNDTPRYEFDFSVADDSGISKCQLWTNISGSFVVTDTNTTVDNNANNLFKIGMPIKGDYIFNINCSDTDSNSTWANFYSNHTLHMVENEAPRIYENYTVPYSAEVWTGSVKYSNTMYLYATIYDRANDSIYAAYLNVTAPNGTSLVNTQNGSHTRSTWTWSTFTINYPYSGSYNWTIFAKDNNSLKVNSTGIFEVIRNKTSVIGLGPQYPILFGHNTSYILNITSYDYNLTWANVTVKSPTGAIILAGVEGRQLSSNTSTHNYVWEFNSTEFNTNGTWRINAVFQTWNRNISNYSVRFKINHTDSYHPTSFTNAPVQATTPTSFTVYLWSNTNMTYEYKFNMTMANESAFNITLNDKLFERKPAYNATNTSGAVNITTAYRVNITITAYNTSMKATSYYGNLSINRTNTVDYIIPIIINIDPPAGNITIKDYSTGLTECAPDVTNICYQKLRTINLGTYYMRWRVENTGGYKLSNCNPSLTGSLNGKTFVSFSPSSFEVTTGDQKILTMVITTPSIGNYTSSFLNITCDATGGGLQDTTDPGNMPLIDLHITDAGVSAGGAGGGGGGGGGGGAEAREEVIIPEVDLTGLIIEGDKVCSPGERRDSVDCKTVLNFDTLITCIWDEDTPCIYGSQGFINVLIYFLIGTFVFVTIRGFRKPKVKYGTKV